MTGVALPGLQLGGDLVIAKAGDLSWPQAVTLVTLIIAVTVVLIVRKDWFR